MNTYLPIVFGKYDMFERNLIPLIGSFLAQSNEKVKSLRGNVLKELKKYNRRHQMRQIWFFDHEYFINPNEQFFRVVLNYLTELKRMKIRLSRENRRKIRLRKERYSFIMNGNPTIITMIKQLNYCFENKGQTPIKQFIKQKINECLRKNVSYFNGFLSVKHFDIEIYTAKSFHYNIYPDKLVGKVISEDKLERIEMVMDIVSSQIYFKTIENNRSVLKLFPCYLNRGNFVDSHNPFLKIN